MMAIINGHLSRGRIMNFMTLEKDRIVLDMFCEIKS